MDNTEVGDLEKLNHDDNEEEHNELSLTRPSLGSDGDYDDDLEVSDSIKIVDMGDGPIAIENSEDEAEGDPNGSLPYISIYNCKKFKSYYRNVFVPGVDITATITAYERNATSHILNPNLYTISLIHGNFTWKIKKRYRDFQSLHQQLVLFKTSLNIPFPSKTHTNKRKSFKQNAPVSSKGKRKGKLPRFPKKPESFVSLDKMGNRMKQIETYLNNLLSFTIYQNHPATIEFLEVSHLSFVDGLGYKYKEGLVKKKAGSTHPGQSGCNCFGLFNCFCCLRCKHICNDLVCTRYENKWFFIKDTCLGYINPKDGHLGSVILFDQGFEVALGMYSIGLQTGFQLQTLTRQITSKCWTRRKSKEWTEALKDVASTTAKEFVQTNANHSFAPVRNSTTASWFVDGSSYMAAVADAIENAKEEIFITDWWLSPEIYLKRPAIVGDYWQLDKLLQRKANSGVKIFILLYKEVEMALGLNSYYSKQKLMGASENIKVLRHPDHAKVGILLWAHHEKLVVVDQTCAFVGGIDLCYGRWDDHNHKLTDLGSMIPSVDVSTIKKKTSSVPAGDPAYPIPTPYYKQTPLPEVREPDAVTDDIDATPIPQLEPGDNLLMPYRDDRIKMNTPQSERKFHILDSIKSKGRELINMVYHPSEDEIDFQPESPEDQKPNKRALETPEEFLENLDGSAKFWLGKDYTE